MRHTFAALIVLAAAAAPGLADEVIPLPAFHAINLHGGGEAILRHGPVQKVTLIKGDKAIARIMVNNGKLDLSPCRNMCFGHHDLKVEIVSPLIDNVQVHGGGDMRAEGSFPSQEKIDVSVHGGGDADIRAMRANDVNAHVHGGGGLQTHPLRTLRAKVHGGGDISYWGDPRVDARTHGGGEIHRR